MSRRTSLAARLVVTLGCALAVGFGAAGPARAAEQITVGTVAPKSSLWGRVFGVWEEAVKKKSDGKLELVVFYNATQGDDATMIGKLKAGQLDGAAVSSIGLAHIHKPILALQIPGLFRTWEGIDRGRDAVKKGFEEEAAKAGFLIGWGDLGRMHGMTKGFAARRPSDLKGHKVLAWRNDVIGPSLSQVVEGVNIVPLGPPEVLAALRTGAVDTMSAPSLAAEQMQWTPHFDHIGKESAVVAIGGLVWSKKRVDALPGDLRAILVDTGKVAQEALKRKVRAEDDEAFARLAKKMTVVELDEADRKAWREVFDKVFARLKQGTFSPELLDKLAEVRDK